MPPSTEIDWPVMYAALGEQRKVTRAATSCGVPILPSAVASSIAFFLDSSAVIAAVMSVMIYPGCTRLTRTCLHPTSFANDFVNPTIPALADEYAHWPAFPWAPTTDPMLTMDVAFRSESIPRKSALVNIIEPIRLTLRVRRRSSSLKRSSSPSCVAPALFTRIDVWNSAAASVAMAALRLLAHVMS
eukprot:CAMPEP_0179408466 /NCGR_PEP_ID=MMETSP0799-20121207/2110_1 /TAXON_ID=46947 /ORGANISM="Geminigera cryophila, Strain CCMP2564" /LENGTH=186 /DNA_ID=CAMNT_0021179933 /DNA_START=183 /DNA_END=739 /DNA_ORIENTATION=+